MKNSTSHNNLNEFYQERDGVFISVNSITLPVSAFSLKEIEKITILDSLKYHNNNKTHTSKALKIGLRTLQRKLNKYGVSKEMPTVKEST